MTQSTTVTAVLCGLALAGGARAQTVDTIERRFEIAGRADLRVSNEDGRTSLSAADGSRVIVTAAKEVVGARSEAEARELAAEVEVRIEEREGRVTVATLYPDRDRSFWRSARVLVHLEIVAPRASDLDVETEDGPLVVEGFEGRLRLRAGDGEIRVAGCEGELDVGASDGDVRLEGVRGSLRARLEDGDLRFDGTLSGLDAEAQDGTLDLRLGTGTRMASDWSLRTDDGDVRLALPVDFAGDLEVRVGDGSISNDHPRASSSRLSEEHWRARLNEGGYRVRIRTGDGSVRIDES